VVLAPGQWYSAVLIDPQVGRPYFDWLKADMEETAKIAAVDCVGEEE
jgi:hypothetical protein